MNIRKIDLKDIGYSDFFDLIRHYTGLLDFRESCGYDIKLIFPIGGKIKDLMAERNQIRIKIVRNKELGDAQLNILISRGGNMQNIVHREIHLIDSEEESHDVVLDIPQLRPRDLIEVLLISHSLPSLVIDRDATWAPIDKPLRPFAATLNHFYSLQELQERLLTPSVFPNASVVFEEAVTCLFALCGLSPINLGKQREHINLGSKYQISSADIIGYKESEALLLIDCTTAHPDTNKMSKLSDLLQYLKKDEVINYANEIIPVIITPTDCTHFETPFSEIKILDKNWITSILQSVQTDSSHDIITSIRNSSIIFSWR